jgi:hypothetical protein
MQIFGGPYPATAVADVAGNQANYPPAILDDR